MLIAASKGMTRFILTIILLVSVVVAYGCGGECIRHTDCQLGYICLEGSCIVDSDIDAEDAGGKDTDCETDLEDAGGTDAGTGEDTDTDTQIDTDAGIDGDSGLENVEIDGGLDIDAG